MKYTIQFFTESGDFSYPYGRDVKRVRGKKAVSSYAADWHEEVHSLSECCGETWVFVGHYTDVTDMYPDYIVSIGPRGGARWSRF